jgi:hypothetical protein
MVRNSKTEKSTGAKSKTKKITTLANVSNKSKQT